MTPIPKIFVIVVTYKGMQWYDRCFTSLRENTIPVQTIVVDNTPGDEDANYIRTHFPEIYLIKTAKNLGFGRANNIAMRYAFDHGCDYIFLLNQDTWLTDKDMFEKLVDITEIHPDYGIISPMHVKADGETLDMMWEHLNNETSVSLITDLYRNRLQDIYPTNYVNAAAWLLPRKTLATVGGFDPIFQHYEEDDDYLNRVRFHGLKVGICPSLKLVHDHQQATNPFDEAKARYRHEQILLVRLTDINNRISIFSFILYYLRKSIVLFFRGDRLAAKEHWLDMCYIERMKVRIENSRSANQKVSATWL